MYFTMTVVSADGSTILSEDHRKVVFTELINVEKTSKCLHMISKVVLNDEHTTSIEVVRLSRRECEDMDSRCTIIHRQRLTYWN